MSNFNPETRLKWVLEQTQEHRGNRIHDLLPWAYQDMINAAAPKKRQKPAFSEQRIDVYRLSWAASVSVCKTSHFCIAFHNRLAALIA